MAKKTTTLLCNIEKFDHDKQIKILKGAIEGILAASSYEFEVIKKNTERIESLENRPMSAFGRGIK